MLSLAAHGNHAAKWCNRTRKITFGQKSLFHNQIDLEFINARANENEAWKSAIKGTKVERRSQQLSHRKTRNGRFTFILLRASHFVSRVNFIWYMEHWSRCFSLLQFSFPFEPFRVVINIRTQSICTKQNEHTHFDKHHIDLFLFSLFLAESYTIQFSLLLWIFIRCFLKFRCTRRGGRKWNRLPEKP